MKEKLGRYLSITGIIICIVLLILVRKLESQLFYDPLLDFFKQPGFTHKSVPEFSRLRLLFSIFLRFGLNSVLTITIIQLWFKDTNISKLSIYILIAGFLVFTIFYMISLLTNFGLGYMPTFYIRRILIQPIMLMLLIPAVYYFKKVKD